VKKGSVGVSVVIPAYRTASTIRRAVDNCLLDESVAEIIVVLDGPDDSLESAVPQNEIVKLIRLDANRGAPTARNVGFSVTNCDFVIFLDSDDYFEQSLASALQRAAIEHDADLVLGSFAHEWPSGKRHVVDVMSSFGNADPLRILQRALRGAHTPTCATLWRSSFLRTIGGWRPHLIRSQDVDLMFRALSTGASVAFAKYGLGVYFHHGANNRITSLVSEAAFRSQLEVLEHLEVRINHSHLSLALPDLAAGYYNLARFAYRNYCTTIGQSAESSAYRLGLSDTPGTTAHKNLARMLGLRRKEEFSAGIHKFILGPLLKRLGSDAETEGGVGSPTSHRRIVRSERP
jgi:glycosyltransferase involved in cell wall biosynthesis